MNRRERQRVRHNALGRLGSPSRRHISGESQVARVFELLKRQDEQRTRIKENIVAACLDASVPVFVKQIEIDGKLVKDIRKFPKHLQIRQVPWAKE